MALAGIAGLEPTKCQNQNLVPYRLGYSPIYKSGVGNRTRTGDIQNHNLALYRLNYTHHVVSVTWVAEKEL